MNFTIVSRPCPVLRLLKTKDRRPRIFFASRSITSSDAPTMPDLKRLREEFAPPKAQLPPLSVQIPAPSVYDALLPSEQGDEPEEVAA